MDTIYHENISCKSKKRYKTIDQANDHGKLSIYRTDTQVKELYIYKCLYCNDYHLTQQVTDIKVF